MRVIVFGPIVEKIGWREKVLNDVGTNVNDVIAAIGLDDLDPNSITIMLDGNRVNLSAPIIGAAELAILPPVSGG